MRQVALKAGLKLKSINAEGEVEGVHYHNFSAVGDIQVYYEHYLKQLDAIVLDKEETYEMRNEARQAFQLNIQLNEEFRKEEAAGDRSILQPRL